MRNEFVLNLPIFVLGFVLALWPLGGQERPCLLALLVVILLYVRQSVQGYLSQEDQLNCLER